VEGAGLGLWIVKDIIDEYRGTLFFKNCSPHGLNVVVSLPLEKTT